MATEVQLQAAQRLWDIANGGSGQCRVVAAFLLGLYNGPEFPFHLTDFRLLDGAIFRDCLTVLCMDWNPEREIHCQLGKTSQEFSRLADDWGIRRRSERGL